MLSFRGLLCFEGNLIFMSQNMSPAPLCQWFSPVFPSYAKVVRRSYFLYPFESIVLVLHYQCHFTSHALIHLKHIYFALPCMSVVAQVLHPQGAVWRLREGSWNSNLFAGTVSSVSETKRKDDSIALETEMLQFKVAVLR